MKSKKTQFVIGLAIGAFFVWWLFRGTDWQELGAAISRAHWGWIAVALLGVAASFITRVQRWAYIVRTAKPVSFRHLFSATQIGFLANFTLPARAGEAIRALVLGRLAQLPFTRSLAFVALDRINDLFGLMAVILVAAVAYRPESDIHLPAAIYAGTIPADMVSRYAFRVAVALMLIVVAFVAFYLKQALAIRVSDRILGTISPRFARYVHGLLQHFADGLGVFRSGSDMAKSVFFSLLTWACFLLTYAAILKAFDLALPWYAPFVTVAFVALAISVPGAPGFIGQFHFGMAVPIVVLSQATSEQALESIYNTALAVAIVGHLVNVFPVFAAGLACLYLEQLGLLQLRRESEAAEQAQGE